MTLARRSLLTFAAAAALFATLALPSLASASPVATNDPTYMTLGRVFPDPLAGCQPGVGICSPNAQGNLPATQFIQYTEFINGLEYMNSKPQWSRNMEVWPLDGRVGTGFNNDPGKNSFPGNDIADLEWKPQKDYHSAGLPNSDLTRKRSDIMVVRVTDESVPDRKKKRYALSLSIHGIERAGVEGGTRALEDLVTAATTGKSNRPIVPPSVDKDAPTFAQVLRKTIIYFTYPNPDGWRRGSVSEGGAFFQRYNGNGVDLNRDWPDIGYSFRPYSALSEPESRALSSFFDEVNAGAPKQAKFAAGDDLHGQPFADALSYTLLPHGSHSFGKDESIRKTAIAIHKSSEKALLWSPIVQPNSASQDGSAAPCAPDTPVGTPCTQIYGQTWGTVYDTINYTTTGALGDYFDSSVGLKAEGIDNEMSFSHLDKNITFDPHTEQLHVDGNKALIYAHLDELIGPEKKPKFRAPGRKGYVPGLRVKGKRKRNLPVAPPNTDNQPNIRNQQGVTSGSQITFPFNVIRRAPRPGKLGVYNGGMRVAVRTPNVNGIGTGIAHLAIQCKFCDRHPGVDDDGDGWVTVSEDFNQSPVYAQSGVTAAVNSPQARTKTNKIQWRAVLTGNAAGIGTPNPTPIAVMNVHFTRKPISVTGETGGGDPPVQRGYDVADTDFFKDLNNFIPKRKQRFTAVDPSGLMRRDKPIPHLRSLVLADDPLPGYKGTYGNLKGTPSKDKSFEAEGSTVPGGGSGAPGTFEEFEYEVPAKDLNESMKVRVEWEDSANDFDMVLYREDGGDRTEVDSSGQGGTNSEQVTVPEPKPGNYIVHVDNYAAPDPAFTVDVDFKGPKTGSSKGTGRFTTAQKDRWMRMLKRYVRRGGNLVLTDGAMRALPELIDVRPSSVSKQQVYVGQLTFATADGEDTLGNKLASKPANIDQPGSRFNSGMRRQTFEPTPLGYAIADDGGADQSNARQYDVDRNAWEKAGGTVAATSADSGERDAAPIYDRVTLGEVKLGKGTIRIVGALLPQPTEKFDHTFGLEPYAVTYTGYLLVRNLLSN